MWMQLLSAAGFPPIGDAFPRNWERTIKAANPGGFWESNLRRGINYQTNPDPKTGMYLPPQQTRRHAVKVFIPGLIRSDLAFVDRVIATVRPWREYVRSLNRLYAMERTAQAASSSESADGGLPPVYMSPVIEWWVENFSLVSDIVTRRYPFYMVAYDRVLESPDETIEKVFAWLGDGDAAAAIREVQPSLRTQDEHSLDSDLTADEEGLEEEVVETFDALFEVVRDQTPLDQAFVDRLNQTNQILEERIEAAVKDAKERQQARLRHLEERRRAARKAESP